MSSHGEKGRVYRGPHKGLFPSWIVLVDVPVTADAERSRPLAVAEGVFSTTRPVPAVASSPAVRMFVPVPPSKLNGGSNNAWRVVSRDVGVALKEGGL
jgi:hypothetical protein